MCICVGKSPTFGRFLAFVLTAWQKIKAWIRELVQVDVAVISSCAHHF
jgi:hypothetical protein